MTRRVGADAPIRIAVTERTTTSRQKATAAAVEKRRIKPAPAGAVEIRPSQILPSFDVAEGGVVLGKLPHNLEQVVVRYDPSTVACATSLVPS